MQPLHGQENLLPRTAWLPRNWRSEKYRLIGALIWPRGVRLKCAGCRMERWVLNTELDFEVVGAGAHMHRAVMLCAECRLVLEGTAEEPFKLIPY